MKAALAPALLMAALACAPARADDGLRARLEARAAAGNAEALYHLGMMHQVGIEGPVDHARALDLFRRAAAAGDPLAAYKLGCFHAGQDGVLPLNPDEALRWKLVAAKAGYALAQGDVAGLYAARGEPERATRWIAAAAAQGTSDALMGMASLHNGRNGLPADPATVVAYFTLFLDRGSASPEQRAWLEAKRAELSAADRSRAAAIVSGYRPRPTALTLKALSGLGAAEALAANP